MDSAADTAVVQGRGDGDGGRVLLLPFPGMQGHANPMLQLGRRLAYHGLRPTLVLTRYVLSTTATAGCPFPVAAISDGFDTGGIASCGEDTAEYLYRMEAAGSDTLARLLLLLAADDDVRVLVYDSHLPWARRVAAAAFMTQMCAVDAVYGEAFSGRVALPLADGTALRGSWTGRRAAVRGQSGVVPGVHRVGAGAVRRARGGRRRARQLLPWPGTQGEEADYVESRWRAKTIGPTLPSFYLDDDRLPLNKSYGFNLVSNPAPCMAWLDKQPPCSVVLASYGTVANLDTSQLEELGYGFCNSGKAFLWVLRSDEAQKLPEELRGKCNMKAQIVPFCPQLEVLSHSATGCFLTHCGWNSTTEAIATGYPWSQYRNGQTNRQPQSMWRARGGLACVRVKMKKAW